MSECVLASSCLSGGRESYFQYFPKPSGSVPAGKTIALHRFSDWHI